MFNELFINEDLEGEKLESVRKKYFVYFNKQTFSNQEKSKLFNFQKLSFVSPVGGGRVKKYLGGLVSERWRSEHISNELQGNYDYKLTNMSRKFKLGS